MRGIIGDLKVSDGITIVDMEAGLELFGRGTPGASDLLVIIVEPSLWSIQTAMRIAELAKELGIPKLMAVANKIREDADVEWIGEALRPYDIDVAAVVPYDPAVSMADRKVRSLLDVAPESDAARAIGRLADVLAEVAGAQPRARVAVEGNGDEQADATGADAGCPWVVDKY